MAIAAKRVRAPQMQPEQRKQLLLEAGVACAAAKGIGATKHADLARACKVSVPTIFTYFPNRESLVTSILNEVGEQMLENVIAPALAVSDSKKRLPATVPLYSDYAIRQPNYVKVWLMWSMHFAPEIQAQFQKFEAQFVNGIAEMIKEGSSHNDPGQDIHDRARVITAASGIVAKMVFDGGPQARTTEFSEHIMSWIL
ncbi:MAG: helix-turn-helix domain-containing protein [Pseudomonadales bacterium]